MQSSNAPNKISLPFAASGTKNTIPVPSQQGVTPGAASFTDGFPPLTFTPLSAGGVPPSGSDFNGVLNAITAVQQWQSSGGFFQYDAAQSTAIGGYPLGAMLVNAAKSGFWVSTVENNTTNPDAGGAGWVGFSPSMTLAQINALAADQGPVICSDHPGTYAWDTVSSKYLPAHGKQVFTTSGTFQTPSFVSSAWLSGCGAGAGGGSGGGAAGSTIGAGGGGGGAGQSAVKQYVALASGTPYTVTIGAAGTGGGVNPAGGSGNPGTSGGGTSFGSLLTLAGGAGGRGGDSSSSNAAGGFGGDIGGSDGGDGTYGSLVFNSCGGSGGSSPFGTGGGAGRGGGASGGIYGRSASGYGAGGGGGGGSYSAGTGNGGQGGNGAPGFLIVEW